MNALTSSSLQEKNSAKPIRKKIGHHNRFLSLWRECILLPLVEYREGVREKRGERERGKQTDIRRQTDGQTHRCQKHKVIKKHDITSEREYALGD